MDIDDVYHEFCQFGRYQRKVFWCISLFTSFMAFHQIHNVFIGAEPKFQCRLNNGKLIPGCPEDGSRCQKYVYDRTEFTSIVSEWDLVCEETYKASLIQSLFMLGILFGSLIFGYLADRYGRRHIIYLSIFGMVTGTFVGATTSSYVVYALARHLVGVISAGFGLVSYVLVTEVCGPSKRGFVAVIIPMMFALGITIYSIMAYFIRDWRMLSVATAVPGLAAFYMFFLLPESPRWLLSQGRTAEAEQILEMFIVKDTGQALKNPIRLKAVAASKLSSSGRLMDVMRHPVLRTRTIINVYVWFVNCAVYYGLTMGAGNLGGNFYVSVGLSGLIEIPAYIITWYMLDRLGRRTTISYSMVAGGIACLLILIVPSGHARLVTSLALLGKMAISMSFSVAFIYAAELYPTTLRNKAMGLCSMAARVGGIMSPFIISVSHAYKSLDFLIFGILAFTAGLLCLRLPETANQPMPETLEDIRKLSRHRVISHKSKTPFSEDRLQLIEGEIAANETGNTEEL